MFRKGGIVFLANNHNKDFSVLFLGHSTTFAVILRTTNKSVWTNEFDCKLKLCQSYFMLFYFICMEFDEKFCVFLKQLS